MKKKRRKRKSRWRMTKVVSSASPTATEKDLLSNQILKQKLFYITLNSVFSRRIFERFSQKKNFIGSLERELKLFQKVQIKN